jgi:hypothetical protein
MSIRIPTFYHAGGWGTDAVASGRWPVAGCEWPDAGGLGHGSGSESKNEANWEPASASERRTAGGVEGAALGTVFRDKVGLFGEVTSG